jgi:hypothetical protein
MTASDIVGIGKNSAGKIIFLEIGNAKAGLTPIIGEHGAEFAQAGISKKELPKFIMEAVLMASKLACKAQDQYIRSHSMASSRTLQ